MNIFAVSLNDSEMTNYENIIAPSYKDNDIINILTQLQQNKPVSDFEYGRLIGKQISLVKLIHELNTAICHANILFKNRDIDDYICYGYITGYFELIIYSFKAICNSTILDNPFIKKEKKIEMLNNLYMKIRKDSKLSFNYDNIEYPIKTDIFEAFNIYIAYYLFYTLTNKVIDIDCFLLEEPDKTEEIALNTEPIKSIKNHEYDFEWSIDYLKEKIKAEIIKNSTKELTSMEIEKEVNINFMIEIENIITEGKLDEDFENKYNKTVENIKLFKKYNNSNHGLLKDIDENSVFDLKIFFREIYMDRTDLDKLCKIFNKKTAMIPRPARIMEILKNHFKDPKKLPFKKGVDYLFIISKINRSIYREYGLLEEYTILKKIEKELTQSLLKVFFSFDYDTIMFDLNKVSGILSSLIIEEIKNINPISWIWSSYYEEKSSENFNTI